MAPGLNGRQTGTVPKNKSKNSGSQSHRLVREPFFQSPLLDWDPMMDSGNKNQAKKKSSTAHSETEAEFLRHELGRSRSSTITSQIENGEGCSHEGSSKTNTTDRKQVASKLNQIQSYVQQTTALINALKASDSPDRSNQCEKLSAMLEDLKDSEAKLSSLLNKMDTAESKITSLVSDLEEQQPRSDSGDSKRMQKFTRIVNENYGSIMCVTNMSNNNGDADEEELARRSEESKKKLEALQKRKQDLLKLQEKAKKQLLEAQAEQSRLVSRASNLNQELQANKAIDLNMKQLSQRLQAVQLMYNTRNQVTDSLNSNRRSVRDEPEHPDEEQTETSDTETDFQLVTEKMEELNAMKAQLGQIQKIMASINGLQNNVEEASSPRESGNEAKEQLQGHASHNSSCTDGEQIGEDGNNNVMKLEQAKLKLNQLTQLLEIVQSAQNTTGLSPSYLQMVSNLVNEETGMSSQSPSPVESVKSPQRNQRNSEGISIETMQVVTRELEETTAAMKEERDRLLAARQELQVIARRLPTNRQGCESLSPDDCSEGEPPLLKPVIIDSNARDHINGSIGAEAERIPNCNEGSPYVCRTGQPRIKQRGAWNVSQQGTTFSGQERRCKNGSVPQNSNRSSRVDTPALDRDQSRWSPSPFVTCSNDSSHPTVQTQNQLEMSSNLCEMMLSESLQRGIRPGDISLQEMFSQHQLLTKTVAQCSQLLWLQQKQIVELRNAFMLHFGTLPHAQPQQMASSQHLPSTSSPFTVTSTNNPLYPGLSNITSFSNANNNPPPNVQQHQNYHPNQNMKLNVGDIQNVPLPHQGFPEHFLPQGNQISIHFPTPEIFGNEMRSGNFNRFGSTNSNANQNANQNVSSGTNNRAPNGINCIGPDDSGALNNQVPPGNRANNYWDNFRSYSRQNLLSNTKSNEDTESLRRCLTTSCQERPPRELPSTSQNNQSNAGMSQQQTGSSECTSDQYLLLSRNARANHHTQVTRSRSVELQNPRNSGKNESRNQDIDLRNLNTAAKNECSEGARARNPEGENTRSVRNDVNQNLRNLENLNNTRNFVQLVRDFDNEEVPQGNNKKRLERTRCRNEGQRVLNNRGYHNTSLWENISSEVSNFIRANDVRPHFLLQLFRDLQQVTTDNLRQRTLESVQETVNANNLTERASNMNVGNVNVIDNRNNIRENRSNLNRNQPDDPTRIDELFYHLRENQNTIRQNIGMSSFILGCNNLENPNISNIRDLGNPRNNLENEGLRDLRTYFEANLCNFGHNSTLENPNLSNIRENLTRRGPAMSVFENVNPKNIYLSFYDNAAVELRRRNQESSAPEFGATYRNFEVENEIAVNEIPRNSESMRVSNNHFELGNNFENGAVGGRVHLLQENRASDSRFSILDSGDNFARSRQFLGNANDSGVDINFNNEDRKRSFVDGDSVGDGIPKKKEAMGDGEPTTAHASQIPQWERNGPRNSSFGSLSPIRNNIASPFIPICENSYFNCRSFQQSDNRDLAEADQSRNEETSGAESDSGFISAQIVGQETSHSSEQNAVSVQMPPNNFTTENVPESDRSFIESQNYETESNVEGASALESEGNNFNFPSSTSEPEGNFTRVKEDCENIRKMETSERHFCQYKSSCSSNGTIPKTGVKQKKKTEETKETETSGDTKKISCKNSSNKFRDDSISQTKFNGINSDGYENQITDSDSTIYIVDGRKCLESKESFYYETLQPGFAKRAETKDGSAPEAESDSERENGSQIWIAEAEEGNASPEAESGSECGSGLDQVPTRLNKSGSSKSGDSLG